MHVDRIDHLVLTVKSIETTCAFYERILGLRKLTFGAGRTALQLGAQKINLHQYRNEFEPKANHPTPGSADICLISSVPMTAIIEHLAAEDILIELGPVERTGAKGALLSVYFRDPDGNLIEVSNEV